MLVLDGVLALTPSTLDTNDPGKGNTHTPKKQKKERKRKHDGIRCNESKGWESNPLLLITNGTVHNHSSKERKKLIYFHVASQKTVYQNYVKYLICFIESS